MRNRYSLLAETRNVSVAQVRDVSNEFRPQRAGIIMYNCYGFYMGLDHRFKEYSDFGGGINVRRDSDFVETAIREFEEETKEAYGTFSRENIQDSWVVYDSITVIIFVRIPDEHTPDEMVSRFEEKIRGKSLKIGDMERIVHFDLKHFVDLFHLQKSEYDDNMFVRVRRLLRRAQEMCKFLDKL